tara:strand:+ start:5563 stop:6513 length:951 start_codon:yes stop_codon:yes gene_type:complete
VGKKILITGGGGFIGLALSNFLSEQGHDVTIFDNFSRVSRNKLIKKKDIKVVKGDIRDRNIVLNNTKNFDTIIHAAYINGTKFFYTKPELVLDVAIKGILNVIEACRKNKVKELILISSSEVYQLPKKIPTPEDVPLVIPDVMNPRYSYGGGKLISELLLMHSHIKTLKKFFIVRPHNVYGENMGREHVIPELIIKIKKKLKKNLQTNIKIQGKGSETRAFIYIGDFVKAFNILLKKGKTRNIYHIGSSQEITIKKIIDKISKIINKKVYFTKGSLKAGSVKRRCPDIKKIKKLGFKNFKFNNFGLRKTINWYLNN